MINHWMFRCKDVSALVSQSMDTSLPLGKRMGIRFHLMMCHMCREYKKQLHLISRAMRRLDPPLDNDIPDKMIIPLPDHVKQQIKNHMPS
ncbi:MAG: hypothetical protein MI863_03475 [Desulfobacterales bacterium]|nr:hypothetical protein [Desulfobacterales bacterium]